METETLEQEALENAPEVAETDEQQLLLSEKEIEIDALKKELDEKTLKIKQRIFDPNYKKYFK